ncbi:Patatin-like protein 6 [Sesamum angolense]|uniref:Patatin-like protein 6 n=1 Tax=Sesamum angolense TaxID=2727404 RepID=A0AAE1X454_9LAMI|nr:Patatin-like protein 6 [Sesamum angolense]
MAGVCGATVADRAMELKSTDGTKKILAVGGGVGMSNPTAAAITHVLNNKQEFPLCRGVEDLLVLSLGNGESHSHSAAPNRAMSSPAAFLKIAADGAADMVDQAVSMAFGEWRRSNYVRVQGNGRLVEEEKRRMLSMVDEILGEKNVESILFKGKKMVEFTNMEKVEMFAGELDLLLKLISELGDVYLPDSDEAIRVLSPSPVLGDSSSARVLAARGSPPRADVVQHS